jgi:hypothetical protein
MWTSNASRHDFLDKTPDDVHYLFASHSAFAEDEARSMPCADAYLMPTSVQGMFFVTRLNSWAETVSVVRKLDVETWTHAIFECGCEQLHVCCMGWQSVAKVNVCAGSINAGQQQTVPEFLGLDDPEMPSQVRGLSLLLADAAAALHTADTHAASLRLKRMHFATLPVPAMRNWLPALLRQWRSPRHVLIASSGGSGTRAHSPPPCHMCVNHAQRLVHERRAQWSRGGRSEPKT